MSFCKERVGADMMNQKSEASFICPICNAENRENARFCRRCGRSRLILEKEQHEAASPTFSAAPIEKARELTCLRCGSPVRITDSYCSYCGDPQPYRILPNMKVCRDCGTQMPEMANFCFACGTDVGSHSTKQVPVPIALFEEDDPEIMPSFEA